MGGAKPDVWAITGAIAAALIGVVPWLLGDVDVAWRLVATLGIVALGVLYFAGLTQLRLRALTLRHLGGERGTSTESSTSKNPASKTPAIGTRFIPAEPRGRRETSERDALLHEAESAVFVALTFDTLGSALRGPLAILPSLRTAKLYVYSLPVLERLHPTLRGRSELEPEWIAGVTSVLEGLQRAAPLLGQLDLFLLDTEPVFTMSRLTTQTSEGAIHLSLRYTPIVEGVDPAATPTLEFNSTGNRTQWDPLFVAFDDLTNNLISRRAVRAFPIVRRDLNYVRSDLRAFVERLSTVTTHPEFRTPDRRFAAHLEAPTRLLDALSATVTPWKVGELCDRFGHGNGVESLRVQADVRDGTLTIRVAGDEPDEPMSSVPIEGDHFLAAFVLIVEHSRESRVVLIDKPKPGWVSDVPGGKVGCDDTNWASVVQREVLEELSIELDLSRIAPPVAWVYDPKSRKEGIPVVAGYSIYRLNDREQHYFEAVLHQDEETLLVKPVRRRVASLIQRKRASVAAGNPEEAECHAPLRALEAI